MYALKKITGKAPFMMQSVRKLLQRRLVVSVVTYGGRLSIKDLVAEPSDNFRHTRYAFIVYDGWTCHNVIHFDIS